MRDSAGIQIVENPDPGDQPGWISMEGAPDLTIGVLEGAPEYQLYQVRDAIALADGRIAIANAGSHEVRFYSPDGEFIASTGREGEGPGEFRAMHSLDRLPGDSILVFDWRNRRLSLLDPQGQFVRSTGLSAADQFPFPVGLVDPNTMLVRMSRVFGAGNDEAQPGVQRDSAVYTLLQWREGDADSLRTELVMPGPATYLAQGGTSGNRWMSVMNLLLSPSPTMEPGNGALYFGVAERYEIQVMDKDGTVRRIIRRGHSPEPVTAAMWDEAVEGNLEGVEDEEWKKRQREMISGMPVAEFLPAHGSLTMDREGRLWVQRYRTQRDDPSTWDVYDDQGEWVAAVAMPGRFRPTEIGADYVLGVMTDEMDVEQVQRYRLNLPEPVQG